MASIKPYKDHTGKQHRDKDGKQVWDVTASRGSSTTRARKHRLFHGSYKEALAFGVKLDAEGILSSSMTFREWSERYLADAIKKRAPRTIAEYRRMLTTRIYAKLGSTRLEALTPVEIAKFMHHLEGTTLSGHSRLKYYRLLSTMLQEAVYLGVMQMNPVKQVRPPRIETHQAKYLDPQDIRPMWEALQTEPLMWRAIIGAALLLGVRRGELVALRWGDVDFQKKTVRIERAAYKVPGGEQELKEPKTASSIRHIALPDALATILQEWQQLQGGGADDYICAEKLKKQIRWMHIDATTKWFRAFLVRHSLPAINLHGLRHTNATLLLDAGVPMATVSAALGHAKQSTTANIYSHATRAGSDLITAALQQAVSQ